jgi:hypothetical protein
MRAILALLALTVGVPGVLAWHQYREDGHERMLAGIASEIAGRPVRVHCQGLPSQLVDVSNIAGEVVFAHDGTPPDETTLKRDVCRDLRRYPDHRNDPRFACVDRNVACLKTEAKIAFAVHVFTHEGWHLRGYANEAAAECYALQTTAITAQRLGATAEQGRALARWNLRHTYPRLPPQYRAHACRDGGPLDLRPDTTEWP